MYAKLNIKNRSHRIGLLLAGITAISLADLYLTVHYMTNGGMYEGNPIARSVVQLTSSAMGLVILKLASIALVTAIFYSLRRRFSAECGAWICLIIVLWLGGQWVLYLDAMAGIDMQSLAPFNAAELQWTVIH